MVGKIQ